MKWSFFKLNRSTSRQRLSPTALSQLSVSLLLVVVVHMKRGSREVERSILHLLHGQKSRTQLTQIHGHILRHNLHHSNQLISHFISICASLNRMLYASLIFQHFQNPNIFLFNSVIKGYSLNGPYQNSAVIFSSMKRRGIWPDEFTLAPLLKACVNLEDLRLGQGVHKHVLSLGFERFGSIRVGVVELYSGCGRINDAKKMFDEMPQRDVILWNLMIKGYSQTGNVDMGFLLFREMGERTVVSWNLMISSLAQNGREKDALELFHEMRNSEFEPDEATVVTVLPVCGQLGELDLGMWIHSYVKSKGLYPKLVSVGNALVDFFGKSGDLETAFTIFKDMPRKNVVSWNAALSNCAFNGKGELGVQLFDEMLDEGVRPNDSTLVGVLACCAHAGLIQRGGDLFDSMIANHGIEPTIEHYGCMVDLLGRGGCLKEAHKLVKTMAMKPNAAIWGALVSACRTHGEMELAECALKELIKLEPWNSGNYVLLSNIYADRGKWEEVEKVRVLMRGNSIKKSPGQSTVV
ncbi:pentatricopeptide repeat-containing protein At1g09190 [Lycium ferocissimum]|uniref:pentatricopeptide repeat-containing protein At1g09190 n=1 Tax=Lycium ferocissimum TaxID=112874 RepID=UPI0028156954|nr:pentatricopeptide repeat-containing protein At1g09190 [Lycium ferocissimum]